MKAIILAAGYATRMYPLTLNKPKALLKIKDKVILDYILQKIEEVRDIDDIFIVTNNIFYKQFLEWLKSNQMNYNQKIQVISDDTNSNETRLGGVGDLVYVINKMKVSDDILVLNSDNLFDFSLNDAVKIFKDKKTIVNGTYILDDKEKIRKHGVVLIDSGKIIDFEEKPINPRSNIISIGIYLFPRDMISRIIDYNNSNEDKEGPGYLIKHFLKKGYEIHSYLFNGKLLDIGSLDVYNKIDELW